MSKSQECKGCKSLKTETSGQWTTYECLKYQRPPAITVVGKDILPVEIEAGCYEETK